MVKTYSPKMIKQTTLDKTICDLCGKEISNDFSDRIEIGHVISKGWGGDVYGHMIHPDICRDCWCNTVLPFLREKGLKIKYEDWG